MTRARRVREAHTQDIATVAHRITRNMLFRSGAIYGKDAERIWWNRHSTYS